MIGVPDPAPISTSFEVKEGFSDGEVYDIRKEVNDSTLHMSIDSSSDGMVSVVCQMEEHEPSEVLWTGMPSVFPVVVMRASER